MLVKLLTLAVILALIIGSLFYFLGFKKGSSSFPGFKKSATISGEIDFNGVAPEGSTFTIQARESEKGDFKTIQKNLDPSDLIDWSWDDASANTNYDIRAQLMQNGQVLASSQTLLVTAPASSEILTINYPAAQTPSASPQASAAPSPVPQSAKISGSIDLNGYVPPGATVAIMERQPGNSGFTQIGTAFSAFNSETWTWKEASANTQYDLQAVLTSNGVNIGKSQVLTVTAPASNEVLVINSNATPPAQPQGSTASPAPSSSTAISGSINFNGVAPQNSSVVILAAANGSGNYQVAVNGVQAANGSQWVWATAQPGVSYQLMAVLKQQNSNNTQTDVASSQSIIASAPASNEILTLNSNVQLGAPQGTVTISCTTKNSSNNTWNTQFNFPSQTGANGYWFQVGTTNGGNDLVNSTLNSQGSTNQVINATINDSVIYYARYAYTYTPSPNSGSGFSSFSGSFQLKCPQ